MNVAEEVDIGRRPVHPFVLHEVGTEHGLVLSLLGEHEEARVVGVAGAYLGGGKMENCIFLNVKK